MRRRLSLLLATTLCAQVLPGAEPGASDAADSAELSQKLSNPVASLISVPIQNNWDFGIGPAKATRYTANIQPVIPLTLSKEWNLILRTVIPVIAAESPTAGGKDRFGLGDVAQSFFFSPAKPGAFIWGAGPVLLYPTGTDGLSARKWGAGPTGLVLKQQGPWTYGVLANHIASFGGGGPARVNATFLQPFVAYTTKAATGFALNTEATYDWQAHQWTIPFNATVSQLVKFGTQPASFAVGVRYYAEKPAGGPDWGLRFGVTFLFPTK